MKITNILKRGGLTLSFEVFPPKTDTVFESVKSACESIAQLRPAFVSVTYGAGGGTSRYTLEIAENIKKAHSVPTVAHLTCVSSTRATVSDRISRIREAGIENVMALRGDIPSGHTLGDYSHAVELVRELALAGDFCIGGACYPEVHPESRNGEEDIRYLKEKVDAGVDFLTSQMFFDNGVFYRFVDRLSQAKINVPIVAGIMPITSAAQVERMIKFSGSALPKRLTDIIDRYGGDNSAMREAGVEYASRQIEELSGQGFSFAHVYSMNKPLVALEIKKNLESLI